MTGQSFVHEHRDFAALLSIVSERRGVAETLVEKDYWVTHTLWALQDTGLEIRFKGGTSLSKGYNLIERFSEDLDVKVIARDLPEVHSWTSDGTQALRSRESFFRALEGRLRVPGTEVQELLDMRDPLWRNATYAVRYPPRATGTLPAEVRPFVQLEVGSARVTPGEDRAIISWIHDHLSAESPNLAATFRSNRPVLIHCVSPAVTLLEKVEAITRLYSREPFEPAKFVRHYEDIAQVLRKGDLPSSAELSQLLKEMMKEADIRRWPNPDDPAFDPAADSGRWSELERAWAAIGPMFWGERISLTDPAVADRRGARRPRSSPTECSIWERKAVLQDFRWRSTGQGCRSGRCERSGAIGTTLGNSGVSGAEALRRGG